MLFNNEFLSVLYVKAFAYCYVRLAFQLNSASLEVIAVCIAQRYTAYFLNAKGSCVDGF